ncbi:alpha-N-acetylglucosaminidase TIM-barrel domain-containing protein [Streptomyces lancefieldiae]|uniref:Alpha-N-acetylglucosaminidase tim-barrel domain-containing protein n=1 Tax=Streptomyces lancefieldiae TaxID=3075520 RepID=A0ABU3AG57_9ACTN|nr:alpha-N-acetylglucosaminidase TIM-barrel domain-containing protein [Streptomyces sp. DSM 40712]MDT0609160.1 hypothetical protein [Streptomyces sp. DSM 40712]
MSCRPARCTLRAPGRGRWQGPPRPGSQESPRGCPVDTSKPLIVDGLSDRCNGPAREPLRHGAPHTFGAIPDFGGHTTIGADPAVWTERFTQWCSKPGSSLSDIAHLPEDTGQNPGRTGAAGTGRAAEVGTGAARTTDAHRIDLVDVARQALANRNRVCSRRSRPPRKQGT